MIIFATTIAPLASPLQEIQLELVVATTVSKTSSTGSR